MILLAKKMIRSNKSFPGTTIHTDENFRVIGTSRKGLFEEEIFLDSKADMQAQSEKVFSAKKTISTRMGKLPQQPVTAFSAPNYRRSERAIYGTSYKDLGEDPVTIFDDEEDQPRQQSGGAWGLLFFVICVIIAILMFIFR